MRTEREREAAIPAPERSSYKTLVVDDSNSIRRLIASFLEKDGFEVIQDINGQNAWTRLMGRPWVSNSQKNRSADGAGTYQNLTSA